MKNKSNKNKILQNKVMDKISNKKWIANLKLNLNNNNCLTFIISNNKVVLKNKIKIN